MFPAMIEGLDVQVEREGDELVAWILSTDTSATALHASRVGPISLGYDTVELEQKCKAALREYLGGRPGLDAQCRVSGGPLFLVELRQPGAASGRAVCGH